MNRYVVILLIGMVLACSAGSSPAQVPGQKLASDGIFTDASGNTFVRVTINGSVTATLCYQKDLPYVLLTKQTFDRLKLSLKGRPSVLIQVGKARLRVKTLMIKKISIGNNVSEGVEGAVIVAGTAPPEITEGAIGKKLLEQLQCATGL
jgi:hypothetical protein